VDNTNTKPKKNFGESIRQQLKKLSEQRNRPFDEILRYYAMERFLYRLSISYRNLLMDFLRPNKANTLASFMVKN
jgi:hypothetical protein